MNGEQISNQNIEPQEDHHGLNYIVWILIVVILAAGAWYFFLRDRELTVEEERGLIKEGQITPSIENLSRTFNTGDLPLSDDALITSIRVDGEDTSESALINLSYLTSNSPLEIKDIYLNWASGNSFNAEETEGENEKTTISISENDNLLFNISIFPSNDRTKVILKFVENQQSSL